MKLSNKVLRRRSESLSYSLSDIYAKEFSYYKDKKTKESTVVDGLEVSIYRRRGDDKLYYYNSEQGWRLTVPTDIDILELTKKSLLNLKSYDWYSNDAKELMKDFTNLYNISWVILDSVAIIADSYEFSRDGVLVTLDSGFYVEGKSINKSSDMTITIYNPSGDAIAAKRSGERIIVSVSERTNINKFVNEEVAKYETGTDDYSISYDEMVRNTIMTGISRAKTFATTLGLTIDVDINGDIIKLTSPESKDFYVEFRVDKSEMLYNSSKTGSLSKSYVLDEEDPYMLGKSISNLLSNSISREKRLTNIHGYFESMELLLNKLHRSANNYVKYSADVNYYDEYDSVYEQNDEYSRIVNLVREISSTIKSNEELSYSLNHRFTELLKHYSESLLSTFSNSRVIVKSIIKTIDSFISVFNQFKRGYFDDK